MADKRIKPPRLMSRDELADHDRPTHPQHQPRGGNTMSTDRWFEVDRAGFAANLTDEDRVKAVVELVQNEMLTDAYSAGVVDSDGCITIKRRKHSASDGGSAYFQLLVVVGQTGDQVPPVLDLLQRAYAGGSQR